MKVVIDLNILLESIGEMLMLLAVVIATYNAGNKSGYDKRNKELETDFEFENKKEDKQ